MNKTLIWAHRGASGYAPENTLTAFQKAIDMQADGIELDVQITKDGELIIIHDETVDRVSDAKGWVKDFTFEEIREMNVNKDFPELGKAMIPTLEEVLMLIKQTNLTVNIELKNGIIFYKELEEKVLALTKKMDMWNRVIFSSFNHYSIMKLKELDPSAKVGFLYGDGHMGMPEYAELYGVKALHPALYNLQFPGFVKKCKEKNIKIHTWTVNEEEHIKMALGLQVDAIITNYPDVARKLLEEFK